MKRKYSPPKKRLLLIIYHKFWKRSRPWGPVEPSHSGRRTCPKSRPASCSPARPQRTPQRSSGGRDCPAARTSGALKKKTTKRFTAVDPAMLQNWRLLSFKAFHVLSHASAPFIYFSGEFLWATETGRDRLILCCRVSKGKDHLHSFTHSLVFGHIGNDHTTTRLFTLRSLCKGPYL